MNCYICLHLRWAIHITTTVVMSVCVCVCVCVYRESRVEQTRMNRGKNSDSIRSRLDFPTVYLPPLLAENSRNMLVYRILQEHGGMLPVHNQTSPTDPTMNRVLFFSLSLTHNTMPWSSVCTVACRTFAVSTAPHSSSPEG